MTYIHFTFKDKEMVIDSFLAEVIATIVWNTKKDSDGVIIVSGDRQTGTGKSVLTQTMAAFSSYLKNKWEMNKNSFQISNIHFDSAEMIKDVLDKPNMCDFIYDEAYNSLSTGKTFLKAQQDMLDFFTECRFKNNIYFIVLPDFYELKENIAVARSEVLVNVYRTSHTLKKDFIGDGIMRNLTVFDRGQFKCWNRPAKNLMHDFYRTTRRKSYSTIKPTFPPGQFTNQYPFGKEEYEQMKYDALMRFKGKKAEKESGGNKQDGERKERANRQRDLLVTWVKEKHPELSNTDIARIVGTSKDSIQKGYQMVSLGL